ncbi:CBO0543 family protein [Rossellomorea aquimaris]|uniref:CBO0543 family protein n=1 Tax=Rossellomorea aquimaris TaxID=189382 RepID=UPI0007D0551B|nr:CBO0543 family protein [Rossellomorea aquimaris]
MYLLFVIIVWILFSIRFIDWKEFYKQYPTILFFIFINFAYNYFYYEHTLWRFQGITAEWLNHTIINVGFTFFICPAALTIFLQRMPENKQIKGAYFGIWIAFFTILEFLFFLKGMFVYENGWNNWHNVWLNIILFSVLYLHYRKPFYAYLVSIPLALLFFVLFPFPLLSMK